MKELQILSNEELQETEGGVGLIAFCVAVACCAAVGAAFGYGAHVGMEEAKKKGK